MVANSYLNGATVRIVSDRALDASTDIPGDRGRRIETQISLAVGELALKDSASAVVLLPEHWTSHCHKCFAPGGHLSRCGRCHTVFYCTSALNVNQVLPYYSISFNSRAVAHIGSKACHRADWVTNHRKECKRLAQLAQLGLRSDQVAQVLLLGRMLRQQDRLPLELVWYEDDMDDQELLLLAALAQKINLVDESFSIKDMVRMLSRFRNNNFSVCDELLLEVGVGCYLRGAMVNHSCDPNCAVTFVPKTLEMEYRAMKAIKAGEEITQTYIDVALPRRERHQRLQQKYHFTCQCPRCSQSFGSIDAFLDADIDGVTREHWTMQRQQEVEQALNEVNDVTKGVAGEIDLATQQQQHIDALRKLAERQKTFLHRDSIAHLQTLSTLFSAEMERGSVQEAIGYGERMLKFYQRVYNSNHPMTGLHLYTLGELYGQQTQLGSGIDKSKTKALEHLAEAQRILRITHGKDHRFVTMLKDRLQEMSTW